MDQGSDMRSGFAFKQDGYAGSMDPFRVVLIVTAEYQWRH